jgi:hypothetical protein
MTPAEAIRAAELAEAETRYRNELAREMYQLARRELGADVEYESRCELEERRWGPGGREHFADPRPGDFPGRVRPEAETELEASI